MMDDNDGTLLLNKRTDGVGHREGFILCSLPPFPSSSTSLLPFLPPSLPPSHSYRVSVPTSIKLKRLLEQAGKERKDASTHTAGDDIMTDVGWAISRPCMAKLFQSSPAPATPEASPCSHPLPGQRSRAKIDALVQECQGPSLLPRKPYFTRGEEKFQGLSPWTLVDGPFRASS